MYRVCLCGGAKTLLYVQKQYIETLCIESADSIYRVSMYRVCTVDESKPRIQISHMYESCINELCHTYERDTTFTSFM